MKRKIATSLGRLGGACASVALLACAGSGAGDGIGNGHGSGSGNASGAGSRSGNGSGSERGPVPRIAGDAASVPANTAPGAWGSADGYYALGRSQYAAQRYAAALDSYRQALRREPDHRDAGNGLAVLYAEQGDYATAIKLWQDLIARDGAAPDGHAAYLFANLGYAYLLSGQTDAAITALEQACLLAPLNASNWTHLASALEQAGQGERAALMRKQAQALQTHDVRADYGLAKRGGVTPAPAASTAAASQSDAAAWPAGMARNEVVTTSAGLLELRRVVGRSPLPTALPTALPSPLPSPLPSKSPLAVVSSLPIMSPLPVAPGAGATSELPALGSAVVVAAVPAGLPPPLGLPLGLKLEIRNGNGVAGMASALARAVTGVGDMQVVKVANAANFQVARTRIEYGPQHELAAMAFAARLGTDAVVARADCRTADLRVVIGRDLTDPAALRKYYLRQLKLAELELGKLSATGLIAGR